MTVGNGSIPLRIGRLIDTTVYGGPYRDVPVDYWGVKMAEEITHPHMVSVPTKDFCVPKVSDLQAGIVKALMAKINEEDVYVGCMGGIGRTGIFLAALAKVQIEYRRSKHRAGRGEDPVLYVRKHFIPHAVETKEQEQFIADLDVSNIVEWLNMTQTAMGLGGLTPAKESIADLINQNRMMEADERIEDLQKPEWIAEADKIDNPAFDRYAQPWKGSKIPELVERDLDWMDAVEADSASEQVDLDDDIRFDDLYTRIEQLETVVTTQTELIKNLNERLGEHNERFDILAALLRGFLTKPTIIGKIRKLFK